MRNGYKMEWNEKTNHNKNLIQKTNCMQNNNPIDEIYTNQTTTNNKKQKINSLTIF